MNEIFEVEKYTVVCNGDSLTFSTKSFYFSAWVSANAPVHKYVIEIGLVEKFGKKYKFTS